MIICDSHVHSDNSFDAKNSVEQLCAAAIEKGMSAITITDHCEADGIRDGDNCEFGNFEKRIPKSIYETKACAKKFEGQIKIYTGAEIGQAIYAPHDIGRVLDLDSVDFVLGSIHNLKGVSDFYYLNYTEENIPDYLSRYFDTVYELALWNKFDSLAHLTYPLRYIFERTDYSFNSSDYREKTDAIFKTLIKNEKALEINTSGLRKEMNRTLPDVNEIYRYRQLGGKYITIGSDAHNTEDLGKGIEAAAQTAKECGFKQYYVYENHRPRAVEL